MEPVAVDHLAVAKRKDLDGRTIAVDCETDDIHRPHLTPLGRLTVGEMPDREEPVAIARRLLEALLGRGLAHPLGQLGLDRLRVPGEKADDAVDHAGVVLARDRADARREAAVDVEVEAGNPRVAARLRPLARPEAEDAVQHVERLADLLRVRVRAEVDRASPVPLPREHDPRILVRERHRDVRERLVVAQADVERRPMALDEVLLEVQRLRFRARDDDLDVADSLGQLRGPHARVAALEVAAHARAQRLRLSHVQDLATLVSKEIDARPARKRLELAFKVFTHSRASVSPCVQRS